MKKPPTNATKLVLSRTILRALSADGLGRAAGGLTAFTCRCPSVPLALCHTYGGCLQ